MHGHENLKIIKEDLLMATFFSRRIILIGKQVLVYRKGSLVIST
jgi:hypothetical protein